jgi:hypothetical protein
MFDNTNFTASAAAAAEPPKPARRPVAADLVCPPDVVYALRGPDGWYGAHVTKEPFPGVYTLTIQVTDARRFPVFEDAITWHRGCLVWGDDFYQSFHCLLGAIIHALGWPESDWCATEYPVPEGRWIDLCTDGELYGQARLLGLWRGAVDVR